VVSYWHAVPWKKIGMDTINDLKQFIAENKDCPELLEKSRGMGPLRLQV